jgi:hypothetical protein
VAINHGGSHIVVPQEFLHCPDLVTGLEHFQLQFVIPLLAGLAIALHFETLGFTLSLEAVIDSPRRAATRKLKSLILTPHNDHSPKVAQRLAIAANGRNTAIS